MNLSILIWLPLAGALVGLALPARMARYASLVASLAALGLSIALIVHVTAAHSAGLQYTTDKLWISPLGVHYKIGVDGLNVFLIALTTLLLQRNRDAHDYVVLVA